VLLDEGVPAAVGEVFVSHGHELIPFENVVIRGSRDELVCAAAEANDALLVAFDNDMKQMARRHGVTPARFKRLSLLKFECEEPNAAARLGKAMSLLEHEWAVCLRPDMPRLFVIIGKQTLRSHR
jgi:predicted nuclease of predicted toxin-antitoxin system